MFPSSDLADNGDLADNLLPTVTMLNDYPHNPHLISLIASHFTPRGVHRAGRDIETLFTLGSCRGVRWWDTVYPRSVHRGELIRRSIAFQIRKQDVPHHLSRLMHTPGLIVS